MTFYLYYWAISVVIGHILMFLECSLPDKWKSFNTLSEETPIFCLILFIVAWPALIVWMSLYCAVYVIYQGIKSLRLRSGLDAYRKFITGGKYKSAL